MSRDSCIGLDVSAFPYKIFFSRKSCVDWVEYGFLEQFITILFCLLLLLLSFVSVLAFATQLFVWRNLSSFYIYVYTPILFILDFSFGGLSRSLWVLFPGNIQGYCLCFLCFWQPLHSLMWWLWDICFISLQKPLKMDVVTPHNSFYFYALI